MFQKIDKVGHVIQPNPSARQDAKKGPNAKRGPNSDIAKHCGWRMTAQRYPYLTLARRLAVAQVQLARQEL